MMMPCDKCGDLTRSDGRCLTCNPEIDHLKLHGPFGFYCEKCEGSFFGECPVLVCPLCGPVDDPATTVLLANPKPLHQLLEWRKWVYGEPNEWDEHGPMAVELYDQCSLLDHAGLVAWVCSVLDLFQALDITKELKTAKTYAPPADVIALLDENKDSGDTTP